MLRTLSLVAVLVVALAGSVMAHAIHISFMQAEWNGAKLSGKVSFYKDDYNKALAEWSPKCTMDNGLKLRYLKSYVRLWSNNSSRPIEIQITKMSEDDNSYIFEFVCAVPSGTQKVLMDNQVLFRQYRDQSNLIMLKHRGQEMNYSCSAAAPTFVIPD